MKRKLSLNSQESDLFIHEINTQYHFLEVGLLTRLQIQNYSNKSLINLSMKAKFVESWKHFLDF